MDELIEKDFARLETEDNNPVLYSFVRQMPISNSGDSVFCEKHIKLIRKLSMKFDAAYSITDLSACKPMPLAVAFDYAQNYIPRQFRAGLKYKAFIKPRNLVTKSMLDTILKLSDTSNVGIYDSVEAARKDIQRRINLHPFRKPSKIDVALTEFLSLLNLHIL